MPGRRRRMFGDGVSLRNCYFMFRNYDCIVSQGFYVGMGRKVGRQGRGSSGCSPSPSKILSESVNIFLSLEPPSHLLDVVLSVASPVCIFCEIDMEALRRFCVKSIGAAK